MQDSHERIYLVGCQRSGTTLLRLILESHPDVFCYDEILAYQALLSNQIAARPGATRVVFKIPRWTEQLLDPVLWDAGIPEEAQNFYRGEKIIFLVRDPKGTIGSMKKLQVGPKNWLETHPHSIISAKLQRNSHFRSEYAEEFERATSSPDCAILIGCLYWKYKTSALFRYRELQLPMAIIRYESLVTQPEPILRKLCDFLELPWDENLLHHERHEHTEVFPTGVTLGNTDPHAPVHVRSVEEWRSLLSESESALIEESTRPVYDRLEGFLE